MYMPCLLPQTVHHLWLEPVSSRDALCRTLNPNVTAQPFHTQSVLDPEDPQAVMAPPLSAYSSARPGAHLAEIPALADVQARAHHLHAIRTLGFLYMRPLGLTKTMACLREEQANRIYADDSMDPPGGIQGENSFTSLLHPADRTFNFLLGIMAEGTNNTAEVVDLDAEVAEGADYEAVYEDEEDDEENNRVDVVQNDDFGDDIGEFMVVEEDYEEDHSDFFHNGSLNQ